MPLSAQPRSRYISHLLGLFALLLFTVAVWVLQRSLAGMHWADVVAHLTALPALHVAIAIVFAAGSYTALTFYDLLAVRFVGSSLSWGQVAPTSFLAYAVGHNVGVSTLSGGALRLHDYSRRGLSTAQIAGIVAMCSINFILGANVLLDCALILQPQLATRLMHVAPATARLLGVINFGFLLGWFWLTTARPGRAFTLGGHRFLPPKAGFTLWQLVVGVIDLACSSAVLFWLLPDMGDIGFVAFIGSYVLAMAAGLASNVPGGLGIFESVLLLTLPNLPQAEVVGAALAFRAVYFLLPFSLALTLLAVREMPRIWRRRA